MGGGGWERRCGSVPARAAGMLTVVGVPAPCRGQPYRVTPLLGLGALGFGATPHPQALWGRGGTRGSHLRLVSTPHPPLLALCLF